MLISIHIPFSQKKCFKIILKKLFQNKLLLDRKQNKLYSFLNQFKEILNMNTHRHFRVIKKNYSKKNNYECIHGKFKASSILAKFPNAKYIIWLRKPGQRLAQEFNYLKNKTYKNKLSEIIKHRNLELVDFIKIPNILNYTMQYIYPMNIKDFAYIGIAEQPAKSLKLFLKMFSKNKINSYKPRIQKRDKIYRLTEMEKNSINKFHPFDIEIYSKALQKFNKLCKKFKI